MTAHTTSEFTDIVDSFMSSAFQKLFQEYVIFTLAVLFSVVPILLFIFVRNRHKAYVYRDTTPMGFNRLIILLLPVSAIKNMWAVHTRPSNFSGKGYEQTLEMIFAAVLLIIAVFVSIKLYRRKIAGPLGAVVYIWLFAAFKNYRGIALGFLQIPSILTYSELSSPVQIASYAVSDYYITLAMMISFLALAATIVLGVYYHHRRYIFLPDRLRQFPKCPCCGKPILRGDCHCRNCGRAVDVNPINDPAKKVLDKNHFCEICGTYLIGGICITCEQNGKKPTSKEQKSAFWKKQGKVILILLLVYVAYYFVIDGPDMLAQRYTLTANVAESSQEFKEQYNRLTHDITLIGDTAWKNKFYTAVDILYTVDSRWTACKPRTLTSNDWMFYSLFGTASFEQMKVLEEIKAQVKLFAEDYNETNTISEEQTQAFWNIMNPLIIRFSNTVSDQENAQAYYELNQPSYLPVEALEIDFFDGLRIYMYFINTKYAAAILVAIAFCAAVYILNFFCLNSTLRIEKRFMILQSKNEDWVKLIAPKYIKISEKSSIIQRTGLIMTSSIFHFARLINALRMLLITIAAGIIVFLSLFQYRNIRRIFKWVHHGVREEKVSCPQKTYTEYKKANRKGRRIWILYFCLCFLIIHIWTITHPVKFDPMKEFMDLSGSVYWDNGPEINAHLIMISNAGTIDPAIAGELLDLIDDELAKIQTLRDMQEQDLYYRVNKDYPNYWSGVFSLIDSEERYLKDFQDEISSGNIPSDISIEQYAKLGLEDFTWVYDIYENYAQKAVNKELNKIAGSLD